MNKLFLCIAIISQFSFAQKSDNVIASDWQPYVSDSKQVIKDSDSNLNLSQATSLGKCPSKIFYAIDPAHQGFSPYGYCAGNPIVYIDPTGRAWYYSSSGDYLGDDGEKNKDIYTTNKDNIKKATDDKGKINWKGVREEKGSEKIGVFGDFVDMNGFEISSGDLRQNLVGLSINMKSTGVTDAYKTITVIGGDRDVGKNEKIGGAKGSLHTKGQAADIVVAGMTNEKLAYAAKNYNKFGEVIFYPDKGDTKGFASHKEKTSVIPFYDDVHTKEVPVYSSITNSQKLNPHIHVGHDPAKHFIGRYTGYDPTRKKGKENTYAPWISQDQMR